MGVETDRLTPDRILHCAFFFPRVTLLHSHMLALRPEITPEFAAQIQQTADHIWEFVNTGSCVLWLGSGLSMPESPAWERAVEELCARCLPGATAPPTLNPSDLI